MTYHNYLLYMDPWIRAINRADWYINI